MITVVLATQNAGKVAELRELLVGLPISLVSTAEVLGPGFTVVEDGATFEENAALKARAACRQSRLVALADDSGLEVDALGGRPGVRSARFAHERATDAENNAALLRELQEIEQRTARFRCVLALATPWSSEVETVSGVCEGMVARSPRGGGGFGYDPLFLVGPAGGPSSAAAEALDAGDRRTLAELSAAEKNAVSHRGAAVRAVVPLLRRLVERQADEVRAALGGR